MPGNVVRRVGDAEKSKSFRHTTSCKSLERCSILVQSAWNNLTLVSTNCGLGESIKRMFDSLEKKLGLQIREVTPEEFPYRSFRRDETARRAGAYSFHALPYNSIL